MRNNQIKLLAMSLLTTIFIAGCSVQAQDHHRHSPRHDRHGNYNNHHRDHNRYDDHRKDNNQHNRRY